MSKHNIDMNILIYFTYQIDPVVYVEEGEHQRKADRFDPNTERHKF